MLKENGQRVMFVADPQKAPLDESYKRPETAGGTLKETLSPC